MNSIRERGLRPVNLEQFSCENDFEYVDTVPLVIPDERQYILRMLIRRPFQDFKIPSEISWINPLVEAAQNYQQSTVGIIHPYCYITIRSGHVESVTDDEWHTDGFSLNITHLPEQNYCWSNVFPTEFVTIPIQFPKDFSPFKHNVHQYIQDFLNVRGHVINTARDNSLYCFDPYVIHRRPQIPSGIKRAFVRVSFTPIEIVDDNNTQNPLLPVPNYGRDAVKSFRNSLERYPFKK